jgi:hypothetical protein
MSANRKLDSAIHHHLLRGLIDHGVAPDIAALSRLLGTDAQAVTDRLVRLEKSHGLVCHPGKAEPWVIHPFSLSPTATWVQGSRRGWWAPCIWCACGVAALVAEDVTIHARIGGEAEDIDIHYDAGSVRESGLVVHFAVPLRKAWDNVHHYCATVLPFRSVPDVDAWSRRHGIPKGAAVPIAQVADLARVWYGKHADPDWEKWSIEQAREIFKRIGLTGEFWSLAPSAEGKPF